MITFESTSGKELARQLANVSLFAGTDDTLPVLRMLQFGVTSTVDGETVTVTATDRFGLALAVVSQPDDVRADVVATFTPGRSILVDPDTVKALVATVKASPYRVAVSLGESSLTVTADGRETTLPMGDQVYTFPQTAKIFGGLTPADTASASVAATQWQRIGKVKADVNARSAKASAMTVEFHGEGKPVTFRWAADPALTVLVMPVRSGEDRRAWRAGRAGRAEGGGGSGVGVA